VTVLRKLACIILILVVLWGPFAFFQVGHAAYPVSGGEITSNATWTQASSPYVLTGNLFVNYGATLTIEAGVTVDFGSYQLQVNGGLVAKGTSSNKIVFSSSYSNPMLEFTSTCTPWNEATGQGCVIDNAIVTSIPIVVTGGSPRIGNTYFTLATTSSPAITVNGGSPSIVNNIINYPSTADGILVNNGSPTISYNLIKGQGQLYGIYTAGNAYISNNNITGCYTGIWATGTSVILQNNIQNNAHDGIRTDNPSSTIQNNLVSNNLCGVSGTGIIQNNTIVNNLQAGIWGPLPSATILYNNIWGNPQNIHLTETANIVAINNWWGSGNTAEINQTIWDNKNDPVNLGRLTFVPFLTGLNPWAPSASVTISNPTLSPTPSPTTEDTSPTPSPNPTENSTPTPTPTPTHIQTTTQPTASPSSFLLIQLNGSDILNVVVILVAIIAATIIVVLLNRRFARKTVQPQTGS
jgi:hypothetical protein